MGLFCSQCGKALQEESRFCNVCGTAVRAKESAAPPTQTNVTKPELPETPIASPPQGQPENVGSANVQSAPEPPHHRRNPHRRCKKKKNPVPRW